MMKHENQKIPRYGIYPHVDKLLSKRHLSVLFLLACGVFSTHAASLTEPAHEIAAIQQQQYTVSGRVTNTDVPARPIAGISISIKGTNRGTTTGEDGRYSITANRGDVLVFSFVGYKTYEYTVIRNVEEQNITMVAESGVLDEVVVVGYGTQRKAHLTGSVGTVTANDLESRPIASLGTGLQGVVPRLTVVNATAAPGQHSNALNIRRYSTWGNSAPLIVVDGVPSGNINILNPDDIESVSVLKD